MHIYLPCSTVCHKLKCVSLNGMDNMYRLRINSFNNYNELCYSEFNLNGKINRAGIVYSMRLVMYFTLS